MLNNYHPDTIEKATTLLKRIGIVEPIGGDFKNNMSYLDAYKMWREKLIEFCDGVESGRMQVLESARD